MSTILFVVIFNLYLSKWDWFAVEFDNTLENITGLEPERPAKGNDFGF